MARGKQFPLSVVLTAVDKATAPLQAFTKKTEKFAKVQDKLRGINNKARLAAEAAGLSKVTGALGGVKSAFGGVIKQVAKTGLVAAGVITTTLGGLFALTKKTSDYGDMIWKASQKAGVSAKAYQELMHAADMSGVSQETLSGSLSRLNKNIVEAANGNKTMSAWFKRAGINIKDSSGKIKSADQVMEELAGRFGQMEDGAKKTALAINLAGRSGAELIPMLNTGAEGLAEMRKEAHDLGLVLDDEVASGAEVFNDNISRMMKALQGITMYIGSLLIPVFDEMVVSIRKWIIANRELIQSKLKDWVEWLKVSMPKIKEGFFKAAEGVKDFFVGISTLLGKIGGFETLVKGLAFVLAVPLLSSILSLIVALKTLGIVTATTPIGWFIAAAMALAYIAVKIYKNWDMVTAGFKKVGSVIRSMIDGWHAMLERLDPGPLIKKAFDSLIKFLKSINLFDIGANIFSSLWDGMKSIFGKVGDWVKGIGKIFPKIELDGPPPPPGTGGTGGGTPDPVLTRVRQNAAQQQASKHESVVKVEFDNLPKGTKVTQEKNTGGDLNLDMGYSMS